MILQILQVSFIIYNFFNDDFEDYFSFKIFNILIKILKTQMSIRYSVIVRVLQEEEISGERLS